MYQYIYKRTLNGVVDDIIFCGKTGGQPFSTVTRPDATKKCPTGTSPCIPYTIDDEKTCYPDADHASMCAITEITFVTPASNIYEAKYSNFTTLIVDDTYGIVYSKATAKLPLTSL